MKETNIPELAMLILVYVVDIVGILLCMGIYAIDKFNEHKRNKEV